MKFVPEKMKLHEVAANIIKTSLKSFDQCTSENIEKKLLSSWSNYDSLFERDIITFSIKNEFLFSFLFSISIISKLLVLEL